MTATGVPRCGSPPARRLDARQCRESVLRRVLDDHGRVTLALVDIAEVARGLSAGVLLASGILPGDDAGAQHAFLGSK